MDDSGDNFGLKNCLHKKTGVAGTRAKVSRAPLIWALGALRRHDRADFAETARGADRADISLVSGYLRQRQT
jgi:hypothetical protein